MVVLGDLKRENRDRIRGRVTGHRKWDNGTSLMGPGVPGPGHR